MSIDNIIRYLIEVIPILAFLAPVFSKLNLIENRALEAMRRIDRELTPKDEFDQLSIQTKTKIALIQLRLNDIEGFLKKQGFHPVDIDEDSFL